MRFLKNLNYNLKNESQFIASLKNKETQNNIIKRGLIEKVFGGIGANQFPSSPN